MAPVDFINSLLAYYHRKTSKAEVPLIAPRTAVLLSIFFTLLYVIPFYLSRTTRPSPDLSRDAPAVIKARFRAVTFSCMVATALTVIISSREAGLVYRDTARILGWWPLNPSDILHVLALVSILFVGPLFEAAIAEGQWRDWIRGRIITDAGSPWIGLRTYVVGPISEELVFRSLIVGLHLLARFSTKKLIFVTPLYFGIAHVHHFYEFRLTHPHTPALPALLRSLFQFAYTSVFGFFAAFAFLRTGSLPAVILAHTFCNWMGLPRFWGRVEAPTTIGPQDVNAKDDADSLLSKQHANVQVADGKLGIGWTVVYYVLLVAGAVGFYKNLFRLTQSPNALITI